VAKTARVAGPYPGSSHDTITKQGILEMRILAIDPGEKRIGLALSDPTGRIASPLTILEHVSRLIDAATIAQIANDNQAGCILVGQALDADNRPTYQSRRSVRLAKAIQQQTTLPVLLWDESGSSQTAREIRLKAGVSRNKRREHLDDLAAAAILQSYLDAQLPASPVP
jgi:putative Holliday junction resolvase